MFHKVLEIKLIQEVKL